jgi:PncC family amidohydrolase
MLRLVFAESCTAGLASATLSEAPGISQWHCGSAVTYRETTKSAWLGVSPEDIAKYNVVSAEVAQQMAAGVLKITPEADFAASITGHLGPDAPPQLDGIVFIGIALRKRGHVAAKRCQLTTTQRHQRQCEAAQLVLETCCEALMAASE